MQDRGCSVSVCHRFSFPPTIGGPGDVETGPVGTADGHLTDGAAGFASDAHIVLGLTVFLLFPLPRLLHIWSVFLLHDGVDLVIDPTFVLETRYGFVSRL